MKLVKNVCKDWTDCGHCGLCGRTPDMTRKEVERRGKK